MRFARSWASVSICKDCGGGAICDHRRIGSSRKEGMMRAEETSTTRSREESSARRKQAGATKQSRATRSRIQGRASRDSRLEWVLLLPPPSCPVAGPLCYGPGTASSSLGKQQCKLGRPGF